MVYSYFLFGNSKNNLSFQQLDCCERMDEYIRGIYKYEVISLNEVCNPELRKEEYISKYMRAISEFMDIQIKLEDLTENLKNGPYTKYSDRNEYLTYSINFSGVSSKHQIATHNLIRYLWYDNHAPMVNLILYLYENKDINMPIEDIFGIAHSFQISTNRALTGLATYNNEGFVYFPEIKKSLERLKNGFENFNSIFYNNGLFIIINFSIIGNFFDIDLEPIYFNSKSSIFPILENNFSIDNTRIINILDTYYKYKSQYFIISEIIDKLEKNSRLKINGIISTNINNDKVEYIFQIRNMMTGKIENFEERDLDKLCNKLNNLIK